MALKKLNKATFTYGGMKLTFEKSKTEAAVRYAEGRKPAAPKRRGVSAPQRQIGEFEILRTTRGADVKLDAVREKPEVSVGTHVWHLSGSESGAPYIPTGKLYIEFKPGTPYEKQMEVFEELALSVVETVGPEAYRVCVTPDSPNPIKCAMVLQKKKIIQVAEPSMLTLPATREFAPPAGKFVTTQWHLENAGVAIPNIDAPNGTYNAGRFKRGADARVKEAWAFMGSLGSKSVKIAVIDTGFDTEHPSLCGDGFKIRAPFHAASRSNDASPWLQDDDGNWDVADHGTSCAAVAAGAPDAQGILGAAPNARIIPIKLDILTDEAIRNAFEHAVLNGADIITCSLGFRDPVALETFVSNFIARSAREGRGGKGLPIFFAAGNASEFTKHRPRQVSDFAAHPDVICVTASNSLDEASDYSFFGPNAFLCAPTDGNNGAGITTATVSLASDRRTLRHGYTASFGGTSSATPLAAGICALMLSIHPGLTLQEIRDILRQSCDKIGGGYDARGHSQKLGFGKINALKAVKLAAQAAGIDPVQEPEPVDKPVDNTGGGVKPVQRGKVISKFLNVRTGPATTKPKIDELPNGAIVDLLEKVSGFWRIGPGRYVSADFIQIIANNGTPAAGTRKGKVTSSFLNVRNGPGTNHVKVGELKQGQVVTIFETSSNGWHRIGDKRWVIGTNIQEI